jgi:hypothetical protein
MGTSQIAQIEGVGYGYGAFGYKTAHHSMKKEENENEAVAAEKSIASRFSNN